MKMVRTSLLAAATGVLISPALMAGDIATNTDTLNVSDEYLQTADTDDTVDSGLVILELGASYAINDRIILDFTGAALDIASLPLNIVQPPALGAPVTCTATITLGRTSESPSQAVYRVTDTTGPGTAGCQIDFTDDGLGAFSPLVFEAQEVQAAGGVDVTFSAELNTGGPLDTTGGDDRSTTILDVNTQWEAVTTTPFDGIVDVEADRERFAAAPPDDVQDILVITIQETSAGPFDLPAVAVDSEHTLFGDFSWIRDTDDTTDGIQQPNGLAPVVQVTGSCIQATLAITASEITYDCGIGATGVVINVENNDDPTDGPVILPATDYSASIDVNYNGFSPVLDGEAVTALLSSNNVGRWVLNGFQAFVPYMPYGAGISQVIYIVNRGIETGDVTVDYTDQDGNKASLGVVATLNATTTLSLGNIIKNALPANLQASGRLGLTVTANVPARDAQLNAQYNASGNRAFSLHDDNRPDLSSD